MSNLGDRVASMHQEGAAAGAAAEQPPGEELPDSAGAAGAAAEQQPGSADQSAQQVEGLAASEPREGAAATEAATVARRQTMLAVLKEARDAGNMEQHARLLKQVTGELLEGGTSLPDQPPARSPSWRSAFAKCSKELRPDKFKGRSDKRTVRTESEQGADLVSSYHLLGARP